MLSIAGLNLISAAGMIRSCIGKLEIPEPTLCMGVFLLAALTDAAGVLASEGSPFSFKFFLRAEDTTMSF